MAALQLLIRLATTPFIYYNIGHPILRHGALALNLCMAIHSLVRSRPITTTLKGAPSHVQSLDLATTGSHRDHPEPSASASPSPAHWSSTSIESDCESTTARPPSLTSSHSLAASDYEHDYESTTAGPPSLTFFQSTVESDCEPDSEPDSGPSPGPPPPPGPSNSKPDFEPMPARPHSQANFPSFSTEEPSPPVSDAELLRRRAAHRQQILATQAAIATARRENGFGTHDTTMMLRRQGRERSRERERGRKAKDDRLGKWDW